MGIVDELALEFHNLLNYLFNSKFGTNIVLFIRVVKYGWGLK